jgi:branched-chain amino acid transport system permease protein
MFWQILLNGLFSSSTYCLVALGLTLILGVMDIADFAQGALYMLSAFIAFLAAKFLGINFFFSICIAIIVASFVGIINNIVVYQPAMKRGASSLIAALGVLLVIQNLALLIFGPAYQSFPLPFAEEKVEIFNGIITIYKGIIIFTTCVLVFGIWIFLKKTKIGKAIRAVSQNPEGATVVGIGRGKVSNFTFGIGTALVGLTGALVSPIYAFDVFFGSEIVVKGFAISIAGGLGSILGTIVGALIIGIGENIIAGYFSTEYSNLITFVILLLALFFRPQGIFGRKEI